MGMFCVGSLIQNIFKRGGHCPYCLVVAHSNDPPNVSTSRCTQELLRLVETNLTGVELLDAEELKMKRVEYLEQSLEKKRLISVAPNYSCIKCPSFKQHVCDGILTQKLMSLLSL